MFCTDIHRPICAGPLEKTLFFLAALAFVMASPAQQQLWAQGLQSEGAIDAIVGSDVKTEETTKNAQVERILAAVQKSEENAERVRKTFNLNTLEIVFLPDVGKGTGVIEKAIEENEPEIEGLRDSIEGSAIFYHAIDSRQILLQNVVAVEFAENERVTIFVTGDEQ